MKLRLPERPKPLVVTGFIVGMKASVPAVKRVPVPSNIFATIRLDVKVSWVLPNTHETRKGLVSDPTAVTQPQVRCLVTPAIFPNTSTTVVNPVDNRCTSRSSLRSIVTLTPLLSTRIIGVVSCLSLATVILPMVTRVTVAERAIGTFVSVRIAEFPLSSQ